MKLKRVKIPLFPSQKRFVQSKHKHPFFIGGLGMGKTKAIAFRCLNIIENRHFQGINAYIFVGTLKNSIANSSIIPEIKYTFTSFGIKYRWKGASDERKFIVTFLGREHTIDILTMEKDDSFVSFNATDGILDEFDVLAEHKKREIWVKALGRIRVKSFYRDKKGKLLLDEKGKKIPAINTLAVCTTPEYKGYTEWLCVRSAYEDVDGIPLKEDVEPIAEYIRGETKENITIADDFISSLKLNLSKKRFRSYTLGYFENFAGDTVWDQFDEDKHIVENLKPLGTVLSFWDFGYNDFTYFAICTITNSGETRILAEYQNRRMTMDEHILAYKTICRELNIFPAIDVCDIAGKQHKEHTGTTNVEIMEAHGLNPKYTTSTIMEGIIIGNGMIQQGLLKVHPRCRKLIDMLNNHSYPKMKDATYSEKPIHDQYEAPSASLRYLFVSEFRDTYTFWNTSLGQNVLNRIPERR